jgi:hypothetical protein
VVTATTCPRCGKVNDAHAGVGPAASKRPSAGCWMVCIGCGGVAVFADAGTVRLPTPEEQAAADAHPLLRKVKRAIGDVHAPRWN